MEPGAFETVDGTPVAAVTAAEMREVDRVAVEDVGVALVMMMENAGRSLAAHLGRREDVSVLAGNGGNGGGGMACARHLTNHDLPVTVVLDRPPEALDGEAARQHRILDAMGVPIGVGPDAMATDGTVVDALVGYGLDGPLGGTAADLVEALAGTDADVVSLDVPSGLDATTGEPAGEAVRPDAVLTLALPKIGLRGVDDPLFLADIGIPGVVFERVGIEYDSPFRRGDVVEIEPA